MKTDRKVGLDIYRILLAVLIVLLHMSNQSNGGALLNVSIDTVNYPIIWLMLAFCYPAVNSYGIMTGFLLYGGNHSVKRPIVIWVELLFYSVLLSLIIGWMKQLSILEIAKNAFPLSTGAWWYINCYIILCVMMPILDTWIAKTSEKEYKTIVLCLSILMCLTNTLFFHKDLFYMYDGYSPLWLVYLYILGGGIKRFSLWKMLSKKKWFLIWIGCIITMFLSRLMIGYLTQRLFGSPMGAGLLYHYLSFTCVVAALASFCFFYRLDIEKEYKILSKIAKGSFASYIVHVHPSVKEYYFKDKFDNFGYIDAFWGIGMMIGIAIIIVVCVGLIDNVRMVIFRGICGIRKEIKNEVL